MRVKDFFAIAIAMATILIIAAIMVMPQEVKVAQEESIVVPIRTTVEEEMENEFFYVKGVDYKFVYIEAVRFGGGGAGGQSDTIISSFNITQFIEMAPKDRRVYVTFEIGSPGIVFWKGSNKVVQQHRLTKKYWVFGENGEGWLVLEENYQDPKFWVEKHDQKSVTFKWTDKYQVDYDNNKDHRIIYSIIVFVIGVFILAMLFKKELEYY